jgi:pimeloyl-ACP methyl ester carboxylesterase
MSRWPSPSPDPRSDGTRVPAGWVPPGRHLDLPGGGRAFVRIAGSPIDRPPVVLLHGLGATAALNWAGVFEPLARRTGVIAIDHRGHGRGARTGNRFCLEDCADDVAAVLRALGQEHAVLAGYSMGGPIAQLVANRHPALVAGLVLAATARDFRGRPAERLRFGALAAAAAGARRGPQALWPALVPALPGRLRSVSWALAELRRHEPAALLAAAAQLGRFTSRDWVHVLDVPATVIVHERDQLVPPRRQRKLAASLPGAEVLTLDADHLGASRSPEAFQQAIVDAYTSVADRATRQISTTAAA